MREKSRRSDLQSEDKELLENTSISDRGSRVMTFDVYFRRVRAKNAKVFEHHKAAMQRFAEQKGLSEATETEFDEIFRAY